MHTLDEKGGNGLLEEREAAIKKSPTANEANPVFIKLHGNWDQMNLARKVKLSMTCPQHDRGLFTACSFAFVSKVCSLFQCKTLIFSNHQLKVLVFSETIFANTFII